MAIKKTLTSQETASNLEERLKSLEEKAHTDGDSEKVAALEEKLDALISFLRTKMSLPF
jgi:hypothetical protein